MHCLVVLFLSWANLPYIQAFGLISTDNNIKSEHIVRFVKTLEYTCQVTTFLSFLKQSLPLLVAEHSTSVTLYTQ